MLYPPNIHKKKLSISFAPSLCKRLTVLRSGDVTQSHGASSSQCQDTTFLPHDLPAQVILCDCCCNHGNEPLQMPSTLAPLTAWLACMDEAWALPWLVLSDPGMGLWLTPAEDPAGCMPPSHHAHACCIPHDWPRPPGPGAHAPVQWLSVPECVTDSHVMHFPQTLNIKISICRRRVSKSATKRVFFLDIWPCYKNWQALMSSYFLRSLTRWALFIIPAICCLFASHTFEGATYKGVSWKKIHIYPRYNPVSCHFCPLIWFSGASVPALQPR